jgi:hypothetical protein
MKYRTFMCITTVALGLSHMLVPAIVETQSVQAPPDNAASTYKVLYAFTGGADGANPYAGLVRDAAGNLYGTTVAAQVRAQAAAE